MTVIPCGTVYLLHVSGIIPIKLLIIVAIKGLGLLCLTPLYYSYIMVLLVDETGVPLTNLIT